MMAARKHRWLQICMALLFACMFFHGPNVNSNNFVITRHGWQVWMDLWLHCNGNIFTLYGAIIIQSLHLMHLASAIRLTYVQLHIYIPLDEFGDLAHSQ